MIKCFEYVDIFGKRKAETEELVIKLNKYATEK